MTQVLYYCDTPFRLPETEPAQTASENNDSELNWRVAITNLKKSDRGLDANGFNQPIVRSIPLYDAMLAPGRIAEWLPQVFQMAVHHRNSQDRLDARKVCSDFSMAVTVCLRVCLATFHL